MRAPNIATCCPDLPLRVSRPVRRLVRALGINVEHVLPAPARRVRIVARAPQPPLERVRHRRSSGPPPTSPASTPSEAVRSHRRWRLGALGASVAGWSRAWSRPREAREPRRMSPPPRPKATPTPLRTTTGLPARAIPWVPPPTTTACPSMETKPGAWRTNRSSPATVMLPGRRLVTNEARVASSGCGSRRPGARDLRPDGVLQRVPR